eukprot:gene904-258_t
MGILRSEPISRGQIAVGSDSAREFVDRLGYLGKVQFEDGNVDAFSRPYKTTVARIEEVERLLRLLFEQVDKHPEAFLITGRVDSFLENSNKYTLDSVERDVTKFHDELFKLRENNKGLLEKMANYCEMEVVLSVACEQIRYQTGDTSVYDEYENTSFSIRRGPSELEKGGQGPTKRGPAGEWSDLLGDVDPSTPQTFGRLQDQSDLPGTMRFTNLCGVINNGDRVRFERTMFRASRGNAYTHFTPLQEELYDPETDEMVSKAVFVVYFQGSGRMMEKMRKICTAYDAHIHEWPNSLEKARAMMQQVSREMFDTKKALAAYDKILADDISELCRCPYMGANSQLEEWRLWAQKEKGIYASLNCFTSRDGRAMLHATVWYPDQYFEDIHGLAREHIHAGIFADAHAQPVSKTPTYIKTTAFSKMAQELVNTYGVPRYREINPALFTIVTFPFFFGVMFGDILHGAIICAAGVYMIKNEAAVMQPGHAMYALRDMRYMLAMMGAFAVYAGFMYNDFMGVGVNVFGSYFKETPEGEFVPMWNVKDGGGPYPFGLDPIWKGAKNELLFANSMKMKCAVLFGVFQMVCGIFLKFGNGFYEKNYVDICCECIPQLIFMLCMFGYMDFLIMYKWVNGPETQPSIINIMINMALGQPMKESQLMWSSQEGLQNHLMSITMITIPIMLIPKPIINNKKRKKALQAEAETYIPLSVHSDVGRHSHGSDADPVDIELLDGHKAKNSSMDLHEEEHSFTDDVVHQMIETIEFVLGAVSHTASYLRLWALSLAHQQLALVFLQKTVYNAMCSMAPFNAIGIYISFAMLAMITFGFLIIMDFMECALHTLRLHWVEFQSKFYKADGHLFKPFCHKTLLTDDEE